MQVMQVIPKVFSVAELILKDEKYHEIISSSPGFLQKILEYLERPDNTETKKIVLRLLSSLGKSKNAKLEIGMIFNRFCYF